MPLPSPELQDDVNKFVIHEADALEISPNGMSTEQLQVIAFSIRLVAPELDNEEHLLEVANAIDDLSVLGGPEKQYLSSMID